MKIIRDSSSYLTTIFLLFVIRVNVPFAYGCRTAISRLGFDLPKFDLNQNLHRGRKFITKDNCGSTARIFDKNGNCLEFCHEKFGATSRSYDGYDICNCQGSDCTACWQYTYNVPIPYRFSSALDRFGLTQNRRVDQYGGMWYKERCHITDFRYHYDEAKIVKTEPLSLGKVVVANQCLKSMSNAKRCPNQEKTLIIWVLTTSTDSWNTQLGAGIDGGLTFTAGVPFISVANTANSKVSTSKRHTLGNSEARQTRWQSFDKCVATPGQMTTCQFYVYRTELQVPFTITRSDGRSTTGIYKGVDYFYGGTAICYKDLWKKSVPMSYNNDCQLPKSFSHLQFLSHFEENDIVQEHDNLDENRNPIIITKNVPGPADAVLTFNNRTLSPRDEQPFINEDNITTSDDDIVNVINVDK